jgi:hypothetical protein
MNTQQIAAAGSQDQATNELLARITAHGEATKALVDEVQKRTARQYRDAKGDEELQAVAIDAMGWEEEGIRSLRVGFMLLTRAVAQPSTFA